MSNTSFADQVAAHIAQHGITRLPIGKRAYSRIDAGHTAEHNKRFVIPVTSHDTSHMPHAATETRS